jgi:hypothetical protein
VQMFLFLMAGMGLLIAWRWELLGAGIATAAILYFFVIESIATGALPRGWVWTVMPLPGLAFLLCWLLDNGVRLTPRAPSKARFGR